MTNRYKVFCPTTQAYYYMYSDNEPTHNPNNTLYALDQTKTILVYSHNCGGFYMHEGQQLSIPPSPLFVHEHTFDTDINVLGMVFHTDMSHNGDSIDIILNPNTSSGNITQNVAEGQSTFHVDETVTQYIQKGFYLSTAQCSLGKVVSIDVANNIITTNVACTQAIAVGTPLSIQHYFVKGYPINYTGKHTIGYTSQKQRLPANSKFQLIYNNVNSVCKNFFISYEYEF